jgi:hypothetical protein
MDCHRKGATVHSLGVMNRLIFSFGSLGRFCNSRTRKRAFSDAAYSPLLVGNLVLSRQKRFFSESFLSFEVS